MQQIKDQQRLFQKLFVSPTSASSDPHLILSFQFLKLLLEQAPLLTPLSQSKLLLKILGLFEIQPLNSLLLYNHDTLTNQQPSLLTQIVMSCCHATSNRQEGEEFLIMMDSLLAYYPIGLVHISNITKDLAVQFQEGKFGHLRSWFMHRVLEKYYGPKKGLKLIPESVFFFYGCNEISTLHSFEQMTLRIRNEMSIIFSVYLTKSTESNLVIARIHTNRQHLCIRIGNSIKITNQSTKQQIQEEQNIKIEQWHRLIINLSSVQTVIYLDGEQIAREGPIIKKEKDREVLQYSFGEQLVGFMTGIAIGQKTVPSVMIKQLPLMRDWREVSHSHKHNLEDIILTSCFPFSTFEMRGGIHCFDVFKRVHTQIGENIVLFRNMMKSGGFVSIGGSQLLLPLFYLARFYKAEEYPDHLETLLRIWLSALGQYPVQKQEQFLSIVGHHLQALPDLLTKECISLLSLIYEKYSLPNRVHFLRYVGWSGLAAKSKSLVANEWLGWLTKLYQNSKSQSLQAYSLLQVVYWLVIHLENSMHSCCPQHYLSEARVIRQFSLEENRRLEQDSRRLHFQAVENIGAIILEYYLIDQNTATLRRVKGILRLLLHKYSTCLYRTILMIFKRQFPKFKDDKALCLFFLQAGLVPYLAALAEKTVDASLISTIVYLLLMVSEYRQNGRAEAIGFLIIVFKRMEEIYQEHFNPVTHASKKVRKRSADFLKSQENQGRYGDLVGKIQQNRADMKKIAIILLNFCLGTVEDRQLLTKGKFSSEDGFHLLRYFMPIAGSEARIFILDTLADMLQYSNASMQLCLHSVEFNELLISVVRSQRTVEVERVLVVMRKLLDWQLLHQIRVSQYFIFLKTLTKSQLDLTVLFSRLFQQIVNKYNNSNKEQKVLNIDQAIMFTLIATAEHRQSSKYHQQYTSLIQSLAPTLTSLLNSHFNITYGFSSSLLLQQLTQMPAKLEVSLFNLEMNIVAQEDITFLFDICLPKAAAGSDVSNLFIDTKRRVYAFQIIVWSFLDSFKQQKNAKLLDQLVWILKVYISACLLRSELIVDKSFARMILFAISNYLCSLEEYNTLYADIWTWIISLIKEQSIAFQAKSYSDLMSKLSQKKIQPLLVQIFETFLRPTNELYLLSFNQLVKMEQQQMTNFIQNQLKKVLQLQTMRQTIQKCKEYAFKELQIVFGNKMRIIRQKIDTQTRKYGENSLVKEVEGLFQEESIGQQETRINYLHEYECNLREYYSTWKKIWKRLRIYHHPYGLFMAQKNDASVFEFPQTKHKNYRLKISKFSSQNNIQPILEAQIIEPWHVKKSIKRDAKHSLSSLVEMTRPAHNPRRKGSISSMASNLLRTIKGQKKKQYFGQYEVLWIKRGRKAQGKLLVSDKSELVFWYDRLRQEDSHLSFEKFNLLFDKKMVKRWRVDLVSKISLRRYLMQWHALQIQLTYKKSLLFYFCDHNQSNFLEQISSIRSARINQFSSKLKLNKVTFYTDSNWYEDDMEPKYTENWLTRKISTLQYLVNVNQAASRNLLDVSQYPVVPWVCEMTEDKQPIMRDLTKTMGALGSEDRKKIVTEKYNAKDPFNPVPPFFFGTHYSSPGVVFNYLIRLAPFTDYCKNLQGGKFDIPDRLFASLINAWKSAASQVSDVREMVPEFYYLPEVLLNSERLNLGITQCGQSVNHVDLPPWAGGNPYFLVAQLRQMLESDTVGQQIGNWIDLIFGCKQKGKEAIENYNVYYYLTYEDYIHCLENEKDEVYKKSCEAQIVHFGQIPPQLFDNPHPKRSLHIKPPTELYVKQKIELTSSLQDRPIAVYRGANEVVVLRRNEIQLFVPGKSPSIMTKCLQYNLQRTFSKKLCVLKKQSARVVFFGKYFAVWGYVTHQFRIFNRNNGNLEYVEQLESKICNIALNKDQTLLLVGCQSGLLHIFELEYDSQKVQARMVYTMPFPHSITHISYHDGFFAISFGCFVAIYKIERSLEFLSTQKQPPFIRFFRSFENSLPIKRAFIADSPLYCILLYDNAHLKIYSINGQLMRSLSWTVKGVQRMFDTDLNSLFCVHEQGRLMLVSTPDLRCLSELEINGAVQVESGVVVYRNKLHFISCNP